MHAGSTRAPSLPVTNTTNGFTVGANSGFPASCVVYNRAPQPPATVQVAKTWIVNGVAFPDGSQPADLAAALQLEGADWPWSTVQTGYNAGDVVAISETTSISPASLCTVTSQRVTLANGTTVDLALPYNATLAAGANAYQITNTVNCPSRLTLVKNVLNGPAADSAWTLTAVAPAGALVGPAGVTGVTAPVTPLVTYPLTESAGDARYVQQVGTGAVAIPGSTISWFCSQVDPTTGTIIPGFSDGLNGGVTVPPGMAVSCEARNQTASLTLTKVVVNTHGGTAVPGDWNLTATPGPNPFGLTAQTVQGSSAGVEIFVRPGQPYTLTESAGPAGYTLAGIQCVTSIAPLPRELTSITLEVGEIGVCTYTNVDQPARLTLVKTVTNTNGGTALPTAWTLAAAGPTPISGTSGSAPVTNAEVDAGTYTLSESAGPAGYTAGTWSCTAGTLTGSSLVLPVGTSATCTIDNDDQPAQLTLVKTVTNDNGGTAPPTAWTLVRRPAPRPSQGRPGQSSVTNATVDAGTYALSESGGPAGYTAGSWSCTGGTLTGASLVLTPGSAATCTINNNDQPAQLTLVKVVDPAESGSGRVAADWTLTASGPTPASGNGDPSSPGGVNAVVDQRRHLRAQRDRPRRIHTRHMELHRRSPHRRFGHRAQRRQRHVHDHEHGGGSPAHPCQGRRQRQHRRDDPPDRMDADSRERRIHHLGRHRQHRRDQRRRGCRHLHPLGIRAVRDTRHPRGSASAPRAAPPRP